MEKVRTRELKFRAWDGERMKPVSLLSYNGKYFSEVFGEFNYPIMQYTGLKDKLGKEIWESDIIKWDDEEQPEVVTHSLDWDGKFDGYRNPFMSAWGSTDGRYYKTFMNVFDPTRYATLIGNKFEHPNLLDQ